MIPAELTALCQWVVWRHERRDGKPTKVPYCADTAKLAKVDNPASWSSFEQATEAVEAGLADGIGFVFTEHDPYCGVDLDNCLSDHELNPEAAQLIERLGSYTERSPSGNGVHVIVQAKRNGGRSRTPSVPWGGLEVYDRGRYFTFTGDLLSENAVIAARQDELDAALAVWLPEEPSLPFSTNGDGPGLALPDAELLERAFAAKNGDKLHELYEGGLAGLASDSEADLAFCSLLTFWTTDPDQLDRLFRASSRMRQKWERQDYRQATISKALDRSEFNGSEAPKPKTRKTSKSLLRRIDLATVDADEEVPWRCDRFAADGYVTVLAGKGGDGKTWLALALAAGVHRGESVAGFDCCQGRVVLFDAESGPKLLRRRLNQAGMSTGTLAYYHVDGLNLREEDHLTEVEKCVQEEGANFVIVDSLARLCPGADEDRAKDMVPVIAGLARMARNTDAAVLVVHHKGRDPKSSYRGSSGILDQADMLFTLDRDDGDRSVRTVRPEKFRLDVEPELRAFTFDNVDGVVTFGAADTSESKTPVTVTDDLRKQAVKAVWVAVELSTGEIADKLGVEPRDRSLVRGLSDAVKAGELVRPRKGRYRIPENAPCANPSESGALAHPDPTTCTCEHPARSPRANGPDQCVKCLRPIDGEEGR